MSDNYEWELSKENVQPLRHGRNISSLMSALSTNEDQTKAQRTEQRRTLERAIMAYDGPDPLEPWYRYILWVEEHYPQGGKEGDLLTVLERCLEALRDSGQYKSDNRLLEVYLRYLDLTESNCEWFGQLYGAGYFHQLASFYINWAETAEAASNFKEGTRIYQLGLHNKAEPLSKLEESFKHYQARVASAVFKSFSNHSEDSPEEKRNAFGELETGQATHRAPVIRGGALPVRQFQQQNKLLFPGSGKPGNSGPSNRPLFILEDENGHPAGGSSTLVSSKVALPVHSTMKAENSHKPGRWTDAGHGVVNELVPAVSVQPAFQVHVDDEVTKQGQHKKVDPFSGPLRDVKTVEKDPAKLFERDNPSVRLMCDLNRLLVGAREFSFEEIRRQCYVRSGRTAALDVRPSSGGIVEPPGSPPVSSAVLLNVCRSREKSKVKTPTDKSRTPKSSSGGPSIPLPPPLKPNEKWACNIDVLYRDGREWSFEQLRAQQCPAKTAFSCNRSLPAVQVTSPSDSEDGLKEPARLSPPSISQFRPLDENPVQPVEKKEPVRPSDENSSVPVRPALKNIFTEPVMPILAQQPCTTDENCPATIRPASSDVFKKPGLPVSAQPFRPFDENEPASKSSLIQAARPSDESKQPFIRPQLTCDVSVQTDLAGLDYDVVLVPRNPAPVPAESSSSSPPRPPASSAVSSAMLSPPRSSSGSGGSSPTVNTKLALSSVKSWFNSDNLLAAPAPEPLAPPPASKKSLFAIYKDPSVLQPSEPDLPVCPAEDENAPPVRPKKSKPFAIFTETPSPVEAPPVKLDNENMGAAGPVRLKFRKPLAALDEKEQPAKKELQEEEGDGQDNFKENVPPCDHAQQGDGQPVKRRLSGVLTPATDIPFDPAARVGEEEINDDDEPQEEPAGAGAILASHQPISRALFTDDQDDQTRHYCSPLNVEEVDFTVPSAMAFARNLHIQSTPMHPSSQMGRAVPSSEDATFNLPRGKTLVPSCPESSTPAAVQQTSSAESAGKTTAGNTRRGLSPIDEMSREYFSSSGSSAGTTGLASRLSVAGRSCHSVHPSQGLSETGGQQQQTPPAKAGRIYPAHFDPFELDHRRGQLGQLSVPLDERPGFFSVSGRLPWLRAHSSVHLGPNGDQYVVNRAVGQGAYAKIYEASSVKTGQRVVLKVQETDGPWEFYILAELERRLLTLAGSFNPAEGGVLSVDKGYFYDSGSILVQPFMSHGTLLDLVNHYRLKNSSMPEPLVFHLAIQLLAIVGRLHEAGILHADIKPDNIMLNPTVSEVDPDSWTVETLLNVQSSNLTLIDFGRSLDLTLYPERTATFLHCFVTADKCPEMLDGRPWSYQLDYFGVAATIFTMLMGTHCKIVQADGQWKVPTLKRGHNAIWRDLTTTLLNAPSNGQLLDLAGRRRELANQLVSTVKPREYVDRLRELDRYLAGK